VARRGESLRADAEPRVRGPGAQDRAGTLSGRLVIRSKGFDRAVKTGESSELKTTHPKTARHDSRPRPCGGAAPEPGAGRPNILMILSDDQSAEFLGASGNPGHQDTESGPVRLGRRPPDAGLYAAPQCVPSRTALLTGAPSGGSYGRFSAPLARGYPDIRETYGCRLLHGSLPKDSPSGRHTSRRSQPRHLPEETTCKRCTGEWTSWTSHPQHKLRQGSTVLDRRPGDRPFFLWVNFNDPHHPWDQKRHPATARPHQDPRTQVSAGSAWSPGGSGSLL